MRFCAYGRVSTSHTEQLDSLENQKKFFEDFALRQGWELVRIYADEGISGKQLNRREQFNQMLKDAETGAFDMVVVKDITRFARNTVDFLTAIRRLRSLDVTVQFVTNHMNSLGDSEFILTIFGALAQEESANLSKRIAFGKKINAQKGRVPNRIYGYDRIDNYTLKINKAEAEVVRQIFAWYLDGWGCKRIAEALNGRGVATCTGNGQWHERGIRKMLSNDLYHGLLCNHRTVTKNFLTGKRAALPPEEWFRHERPALAVVTPVQFAAVQEEKKRRRQLSRRQPAHAAALRRPGRRPEDAHIFSTIFVCGCCKSSMVRKMSRRTDKSTREYWVCYRHDHHLIVPAGPLAGCLCERAAAFEECDLYGAVKQFFDCFIQIEDANMQRLAQTVNEMLMEKNDTEALRNLQIEQRNAKNKRNALLDLYMQGALTEEELHVRLKQAKAEEQALRLEASRLSFAGKGVAGKPPSEAWMRSMVQSCMTLEALKNTDLHDIFDRIELTDDRIACFYVRGFEKPVFRTEVSDSRINKIKKRRSKGDAV